MEPRNISNPKKIYDRVSRYHGQINLLYIVYKATVLSGGVLAHNESSACLDHSECNAGFFCAMMICTEHLDRDYICGACRPCDACLCHSDSVDGKCPLQQCPQQPTNSIRFLQGPFYSRMDIPTIQTYKCVRRLDFAGGTFADMQTAVRADHPASATTVNLTFVQSYCRAFVRLGVVADLGVYSSPSGKGFLLDVIITSEGHPTRRKKLLVSITIIWQIEGLQ